MWTERYRTHCSSEGWMFKLRSNSLFKMTSSLPDIYFIIHLRSSSSSSTLSFSFSDSSSPPPLPLLHPSYYLGYSPPSFFPLHFLLLSSCHPHLRSFNIMLNSLHYFCTVPSQDFHPDDDWYIQLKRWQSFYDLKGWYQRTLFSTYAGAN